MQAIVDNTGENAVPVNPYTFSNVVPMVGLTPFESYHEFKDKHPSRPLTIKQEPNKVIKVEEVWQVEYKLSEWFEDVYTDKAYVDYSEFKEYWHPHKTRIAYAPIEEKSTPVSLEDMIKHTMDRMPALDALSNQMIDKETLEQAAEKDCNKRGLLMGANFHHKQGFISGAHHQAAITRAEVLDEVKTLLTEYYSKAAIENIINQLKTP